MKKYEFTGETKVVNGVTLKRIRAARDFSDVTKGELGGWITKEDNLSHTGSCWLYDNSKAFGNSVVSGGATARDNALIFGSSSVRGNATISGFGKVFGNAKVEGDSKISGSSLVFGNAIVKGSGKVLDVARVCGVAIISGYVCVDGKELIKD